MEIILLAYLSYRNGLRARLKGLNGFVWTGYTALAFIVALIIGYGIVISYFCGNVINLAQLSGLDQKNRIAMSQKLAEVIAANPLNEPTIIAFGIGGYLLIRFILEQKPGKKQEV